MNRTWDFVSLENLPVPFFFSIQCLVIRTNGHRQASLLFPTYYYVGTWQNSGCEKDNNGRVTAESPSAFAQELTQIAPRASRTSSQWFGV